MVALIFPVFGGKDLASFPLRLFPHMNEKPNLLPLFHTANNGKLGGARNEARRDLPHTHIQPKT